jgi:hypothetical protein
MRENVTVFKRMHPFCVEDFTSQALTTEDGAEILPRRFATLRTALECEGKGSVYRDPDVPPGKELSVNAVAR